MLDYGKNFIKARNMRGIDQKDAAASLDISPSFLSKIENNKKKPSLDLIIKAASFYGVKEAFFFQDPGEVDINDLYTKKNTEFIKDLSTMTTDEIDEKYKLKLDGKEITKEELKGFIAFIRSIRSIDE